MVGEGDGLSHVIAMAKRDSRWWRTSLRDEVHETIAGTVLHLIQHTDRRKYYAAWRSLYADEPVPGVKDQGRERRARHNLIASLVDAAHAKQIKQRPKPMILTTEGDTVQQRKAEELTEWCAGEFERLDLYEAVLEPAAMESKLVGTGWAKVYAYDGKPCAELCYDEDFFFDPREEKHNCVRTLYHARPMDRWVLAEEYRKNPRMRKAILDAPGSTHDYEDPSHVDDMADLILVIEAWRLPSSEREPGRHAICIEGATLLHEEYTKKKFPFRKLHWKPKPRSIRGIGIVEGEAGSQAELNELTASISRAYNRCVPFMIASQASGFNPEQVTNEEHAWYKCSGDVNQIKVHMPPPVLPDYTMREDRLIARAFERNRISQLSAQGQKPAGLNSGKALVVHNDIDNENHIVPNRAYERFAVEIGEALIEVAEDLVREAEEARERGEEVEIPKLTSYAGKNALQAIDFKDVRLQDQPMVMRTYPISALAQTPQARFEQVADMMNTGMIPVEEARKMLDNPDIDARNRRAFAARNLIEKMLDEALAKGKRSADLVCRYMDLNYARQQAWLTFCEARFIGAPQSHVDAVEEICGAIDTEIKNMEAEAAEKAAAEQAAMQAANAPPMPGPMAAPAPLPAAGMG